VRVRLRVRAARLQQSQQRFSIANGEIVFAHSCRRAAALLTPRGHNRSTSTRYPSRSSTGSYIRLVTIMMTFRSFVFRSGNRDRTARLGPCASPPARVERDDMRAFAV